MNEIIDVLVNDFGADRKNLIGLKRNEIEKQCKMYLDREKKSSIKASQLHTNFLSLPDELHIEIALRSPYNTVMSLCRSNKTLREICNDNQFWYNYCIYHHYIDDEIYDGTTNYRYFARHPKLMSLLKNGIVDETTLPYLMGLDAKEKRLLFDGDVNTQLTYSIYKGYFYKTSHTEEIEIYTHINESMGPRYHILDPSNDVKERFLANAYNLLESRDASDSKNFNDNLNKVGEEAFIEAIEISSLSDLLTSDFEIHPYGDGSQFDVNIQTSVSREKNILKISMIYSGQFLGEDPVQGPIFEYVLPSPN